MVSRPADVQNVSFNQLSVGVKPWKDLERDQKGLINIEQGILLVSDEDISMVPDVSMVETGLTWILPRAPMATSGGRITGLA